MVLAVPDGVAIHYPCADGAACAILVKDFFKTKTPKVYHYTHGKSFGLPDTGDITGKVWWFCDCCPPIAKLIELSKDFKQIIVKDHHQSTIDMVSRHREQLSKWPIVFELEQNNTVGASGFLWKQIYCFGLLAAHIKVADLTQIVTDYAQQNSDVNAPQSDNEAIYSVMPRWLRVINLYDTGQFSKLSERDLDYHAGLTQDISINALQLNIDGNSSFISVVEQRGRALRTQRLEKSARLAQTMQIKPVRIRGTLYNVGYITVHGSSMVADVAKAVFTKGSLEAVKECKHGMNDPDFLAIQFRKTGELAEFSLRTWPTSNLDLSQIASAYNSLPGCSGGGHKAASGVQIRISDILDGSSLPDVL